MKSAVAMKSATSASNWALIVWLSLKIRRPLAIGHGSISTGKSLSLEAPKAP